MSKVVLQQGKDLPPQTSKTTTQHKFQKEQYKQENSIDKQTHKKRKYIYLKCDCSEEYYCQPKDDCTSNTIRKYPTL